MLIFNKLKNLVQCDSGKALFHKRLEGHYSRLYRLAYAWTHNAHLSEDLVQDLMLKAMEKRKQLDDLDNLEPWLCKILHNLYIDKLRDDQKWQWVDSVELHEFPSLEFSGEQHCIENQQHHQLQIALEKLSVEHRTVITLIDLQELSYQQTAQILNIPEGTVMSRLSRARSHLKQHLTKKHNKSSPGELIALKGGE